MQWSEFDLLGRFKLKLNKENAKRILISIAKACFKAFFSFLNTVISPRFTYKPLRLYNVLKPLNKKYKGGLTSDN